MPAGWHFPAISQIELAGEVSFGGLSWAAFDSMNDLQPLQAVTAFQHCC